MRIKFTYCILFLTFASCMAGCKKDLASSSAPSISLSGVNATSIRQFKDSLVITLEYNDANGDLGETDPDKNSLQIKDRRLEKPDYYFVKPLAPPGSNIKIKGKISMQVRNTFLLGTANNELTIFDIKIKDRAGNWSNMVSTPEITITR
jgi:hypothetical protein